MGIKSVIDMINHTDVKQWVDNVQLVETTDVVLGGASGTANVATKQLADRTAFLYDLAGRFEDVDLLVANTGATTHTLVKSETHRRYVEVYFANNVNYTLTLGNIDNYAIGDIVHIGAFSTINYLHNVRVIPYGSNKIIDYTGEITQFWMYSGENAMLVKYSGTEWKMLHFEGNHYKVGDEMMAYREKRGAILRNGALLERAKYPRLWAWAQGFPNTQLLSDAVWDAPADPGVPTRIRPNRSMWSTGDGTTTFRIPDDRGLFERALSLGSGNDPDRQTAGSDTYPGSRQEVYGGYNLLTGSSGIPATYEIHPRNVGKLPLLIY